MGTINYKLKSSPARISFTCQELCLFFALKSRKSSGIELLFRCPICTTNEKTGSNKFTLSINPSKGHEKGGVWHCFRCKQGGGRWKLAQFLNRFSTYDETRRWLRATGFLNPSVSRNWPEWAYPRTLKLFSAQYKKDLSSVMDIKHGVFILQQLDYWVRLMFKKYRRPAIYNTSKEWMENLPFGSEKTLQRHLKKLEALALVHIATGKQLGIRSYKRNRRKRYFLLNYEKLNEIEKGIKMLRGEVPSKYLIKSFWLSAETLTAIQQIEEAEQTRNRGMKLFRSVELVFFQHRIFFQTDM
jgi:hypothetical protein